MLCKVFSNIISILCVLFSLSNLLLLLIDTYTGGIPNVRLVGTVEDWEKVREKAKRLAKYDLEWWIVELIPVLDEFVNAMKGKVDNKFWKSLYKLDDSSGGP